MASQSLNDLDLYFYDFDKGPHESFSGKQQEVSTLTSNKGKKLERNRISAQNSRLKKKQHLESLEQNEKKLTAQIKAVEQQLQETKKQLNKFLIKNKENDSFNHYEKPTYDRLRFLIRENGQIEQDEVNMLVELLQNRVGVTGKERQRMVEYYSKRLINFSIPAIYRYLLKTAAQSQGIFNQEPNSTDWDFQLIKSLELTPQQKQKLLNRQKYIFRESKSWAASINSFNQTRSDIFKLSTSVEQELLKMRQYFSVRQLGQIILTLEEHKYNKDFSYDDIKEVSDKPKKKLKIE